MALTFVGSVASSAINGLNVTLSLSGISGIQDGDLVYACSGTFGRAGNEGRIGNALGFTADRDTTNTIRLRTAYKSYASATDGTLTVEGSGNTADGMSAVAFVFRGQDTTALDVTSTTATGSSTNPNPPSITPANNNSCIIAGAVSSVRDTSPGTVANYTEPTAFTANSNDTNANTAAMAYRILTGGGGAAEDPAAFSSWSTATWVAFTVAIRPLVLAEITGTLAATETGDDATSDNGEVAWAAALAVAEAADVFAASGTVEDTLGTITGMLAAVEDWDTVPPVLLLHCEGADAATSFPDDSGKGHAVTPFGTAQVDTGHAALGSGAAQFLGPADYLQLDGSSDFAFGGDFTVETRVEFDAYSDYVLFDWGGSGPQLKIGSDGKLVYSIGGVAKITGTTVLALDTKYHVALARAAGITRLFLAGTQEGSNYVGSDDITISANRPRIAA